MIAHCSPILGHAEGDSNTTPNDTCVVFASSTVSAEYLVCWRRTSCRRVSVRVRCCSTLSVGEGHHAVGRLDINNQSGLVSNQRRAPKAHTCCNRQHACSSSIIPRTKPIANERVTPTYPNSSGDTCRHNHQVDPSSVENLIQPFARSSLLLGSLNGWEKKSVPSVVGGRGRGMGRGWVSVKVRVRVIELGLGVEVL
jgi:hypothetical protein